MQTPGFTATASLSQTPRGGGGSARTQVRDAQPAVVPAQVDWDRVSLLSSSRAPRWLWEDGGRLCPRDQESVWVPECCTRWNPRTRELEETCDPILCGGSGHFECQPIRLRVVA